MASLTRKRKQLQDLHQFSPESAFRQLAGLLDRDNGPWPFQDLLRCYQRLWKGLPEIAKDGSCPDWKMEIGHAQHRLKCVTPHMTDLMSCDPQQPALLDPQSGRQISHAKVRRFVEEFDLMIPDSARNRKPRVAVVLPNGPLLALASLAIANRYTLVPMAYATPPEELMADIDTVQAEAIVMLEADVQRFQMRSQLRVFAVQPLDDLTFSVSCINPAGVLCPAQPVPNGPDDIVIVLAMSGTSGTKKLVPMTMLNLLAGTIFTIDGLRLTHESRCLNMMPLHHVGGMIRSLWAPLLGGGMTICCPHFDPNLFWDVVEQYHPTWYYAAPTMHGMIVAEAEHRPQAVSKSTMQFICNAAAGLPPNLAAQLQNIFRCPLSPGYGMTECIPITATPPTGDSSRSGSSGLAVGPELAIFDAQHSQQHAPPDRSSFTPSGWFDTGELGYVDEQGWLYITGRSKEVINRGGETISPVEIEDAILSAAQDPFSNLFGRISDALAFPTPHETLQEVVGVAIVTPTGRPRPDLRQMHQALKERLHQPKWPTLLVYMDDLPKSQNKLRRIGLSRRLGLETLNDQILAAERHHEAQCPPVDTPVSVPIVQARCEIDPQVVETYLAQASGMSDVLLQAHADGYPRAILFRDGASEMPADEILAHLGDLLHGYLIPSRLDVLDGPIPRDTHGLIDEVAVQSKIRSLHPSPSAGSPIQQQLCELFAAPLSRAPEDMTPATDFFECGGDSLSAGRLISKIRQEFRAPVAGDALFQHSTVGAMTAIIEASTADLASRKVERQELPGCRGTYSSTRPLVLFLNLLPSGIFYTALACSSSGIFDRYDCSRIWYYRALGARIGRNVRIDEYTTLGEYDLIDIGDRMELEHCICRPFASERNTSMLLLPISIGANSYVGIRSNVVPGTTLAPDTCIGPNSSTWEVDDADESNRDLASTPAVQPHWIWQISVVVWLEILVGCAGELPRLAGLLLIVSRYPTVAEDRLRHTISWLTSPTRIGYFLAMRLYSALAGPIPWFFAVYAVKRALDALCGRPQRGPVSKLPPAQRVRRAVLEAILPNGDISRLARIVGLHYELMSVAVRMLGARVGKRVYWPGTGVKLIPDFDLVEIGNDVVFGSRSYLVTEDRVGREPIVIGDGAMLRDRAVVLPGVTIGTRAMVGSGALLRRDGTYPDDSVWTGSKHGDAVRFPQLKGRPEDADRALDTSRPFGRPLYQGLANYHVLGMGPIIAYSSLVTAFIAVYAMVVPLSGLLVVRRLLPMDLVAFEMRWWRPFAVYGVLAAIIAAVTLVQGVVSLGIVIATKWILIGQRHEGSYPYDHSSYCQRWQIQRTVDHVVNDSFGGVGLLPLFSGTAYLCWFYRAMGATIGSDCALAANGDPNILPTEPDLLTVDDASLVCHLNTRGDFELHPLRVGDRSVMRTGSRLLSGASMGADACLLEHTLVMSGHHVGDGETLQGWPAAPFMGDRLRP
ncbi:acetyl-CoA synthetase-like protein [Aspergillus sclerotiicarbonarius CBS 121057]|uniref:Acetyl-CoA synthetase-like protein n=1 Tax=Aspergillus sclerotiicarbonarius (strain CBS 121057 / IBT 28362) TaxID=1448318 RepID=A0A319DZ35_ASPSB|nr:acetyl-CoA synthetase-like protein [Aspergillus sclerotiicarbonarius CBS 121057]